MKRKTNLFYLSGDDSNFITFSNYTEALTGNYLATDWKMFPSKFICMNIKYLASATSTNDYNSKKKVFIKYIASYYENKMAFLRDYCLNNDLNVEKTLSPLNYLLEALYRFNYENSSTSLNDYDSIPDNNDETNIAFIGDITEQDYNGIYSDMIQIINSSDVRKGNIILKTDNDDTDEDIIEYSDNGYSGGKKFLYGWYENKYIGTTDYATAQPIFDKDTNYYTNSKILGISTANNEDETNISFNILIPLFDLVNINCDTNTVKLVEDETFTDENGDTINGIDLSTSTNYIKNVPIGIWFSEETVELKRNETTGYAPSWSLLLSSQFKPFPYSQKMPNEITQDSTKEAFATYSQVLIKQNKLLDKFEEMSSDIGNLRTYFNTLSGQLNTVSTPYSLDTMHKEMLLFEKNIEDKFDAFKKEIYAYITNTWKGYIA